MAKQKLAELPEWCNEARVKSHLTLMRLLDMDIEVEPHTKKEIDLLAKRWHMDGTDHKALYKMDYNSNTAMIYLREDAEEAVLIHELEHMTANPLNLALEVFLGQLAEELQPAAREMIDNAMEQLINKQTDIYMRLMTLLRQKGKI